MLQPNMPTFSYSFFCHFLFVFIPNYKASSRNHYLPVCALSNISILLQFLSQHLLHPQKCWQLCKRKKNHFKVFAVRKWNVLELSVITRSPASSSFILCGQLVTRTSNKVKEPIPSKPFVNQSCSVKAHADHTSQKTQKRLYQNKPRLGIRCRVKVVFRTPFLWIQERRQKRTSIFFKYGC